MNLIYDRTESDVALVYTLKAKFVVVDTVGSYIEIQDLGGGKHLVFTGTSAELNSYMAGLKGAWNYTDLNRIGNALLELSAAFDAVGIDLPVVAKNDWQIGDIPTQEDADNLLSAVDEARIKGEVPGVGVSTLDGLTYVTANRIEEIIQLAYEYTQRVNGRFNHCGTAICGSEGVIA